MEVSKPNNDRIKTFDVAKFIAIFAVLWGHAIQYLTSRPCYEDSVYQIIYSFHMPLFMVIVGYFSINSFKKGAFRLIKSKIIQLIIPGVSIGLIICVLMKYKWEGIIETLVYGLWFLKAAFLCFLMYMPIYFNKSKRIRAVLIIATLIASQFIYYSQFNLMYPCFLVGVVLKQFWPKMQVNKYIIAGLIGVIFFTLLFFWDESFWKIPDGHIYPIHNTAQYLVFFTPFYYRLIIGILGSVFIIMLCEIICASFSSNKIVNYMAIMGRDTLGIYLLQTVILEAMIWRFIRFDNVSPMVLSVVIAPAVSLIYLFICIFGVKMLRKSSLTAKLFLGESK